MFNNCGSVDKREGGMDRMWVDKLLVMQTRVNQFPQSFLLSVTEKTQISKTTNQKTIIVV